MSSATVLGVRPDKRPIELLRLRNAHGWAPSIWTRLIRERTTYEGYLFSPEGQWYLDLMGDNIEALPKWQQAPLILTFDTGVIPRSAFEFDRRLPAPSTEINHIPAVAELLASDPEVPYVGVWTTSVTDNPFDPEEGRGIPLTALHRLDAHQ